MIGHLELRGFTRLNHGVSAWIGYAFIGLGYHPRHSLLIEGTAYYLCRSIKIQPLELFAASSVNQLIKL